MSRLTYWYSGLSRGAKTGITIGGIALAVIAAIAILYLVLTPEKVEVRYGTIVWDPIDGHVWEDNTETIRVEASEAGNYRVERIEKLSPEHQEQVDKQQEEIAKQQEAQKEAGGFENIESAFPADTFAQLNALQQNIETAGSDIISGMEMANQIYTAQLKLIDYRNQAASLALPPELEGVRTQALHVLDMYINACDLYLDAIASGDLNLVDQANALIQEANGIVQGLIPSY
jgi:putative lipoic acid-binding regulatory protein